MIIRKCLTSRPGRSVVAVWLGCTALAPGAVASAPVNAAAASQSVDRKSAQPSLPSVRPRTTSTRIVKSAEGRDYTIFISAPSGPAPEHGFPVLYVLDANAWFGLAAEVTRLYELEGEPAIVVGIGYPVDSLYSPQHRGHDFTLGPPVAGEIGPYKGTEFGGAPAFLTFLRTSLRDEIARHFAIDRSRQSIFGHSLGGYFVLHALLTQPDAFSAFVAASPAIWWDPAKLEFDESAVAAAARGPHRPAVLVTVGSAEQELGAADENLFRQLHAVNPQMFGGLPIDDVIARTRAEMAKSKMVDNARGFAQRLNAVGLEATFVAFDEENHRSAVAPSLGRAMPRFFGKTP